MNSAIVVCLKVKVSLIIPTTSSSSVKTADSVMLPLRGLKISYFANSTDVTCPPLTLSIHFETWQVHDGKEFELM